MSKWPDFRVSLPQDQPTRYLDSGLVRDSVGRQLGFGFALRLELGVSHTYLVRFLGVRLGTKHWIELFCAVRQMLRVGL